MPQPIANSSASTDALLQQALQFVQTQPDQAFPILQELLGHSPNHPEALRLLGLAHAQKGDYKRALKPLKQSVAIWPESPVSQDNLGMIYQLLGHTHDAAKAFQQAVQLNPQFVAAHHNLGTTLCQLNKLDEAEQCFLNALKLKLNAYNSSYNLARLYESQQKAPQALHFAIHTFQFIPDNLELRQLLVRLIKNNPTEAIQQVNPAILESLFTDPRLTPSDIRYVTCQVAKQMPAVRQLLTQKDALSRADILALNENTLFLSLLTGCVIQDRECETALTQLRKWLAEHQAQWQGDNVLIEITSALAQQCFINEYLYQESEIEKQVIESLEAELAQMAKEGATNPGIIAQSTLLACYRPLFHYEWAGRLPVTEQNRALIRMQREEPKAEQALSTEMPSLTSIDQPVSQAVRNQYEANPYPRWVRYEQTLNRIKLAHAMQRATPKGTRIPGNIPERPDIFIAGCGTGQQLMGLKRILHQRLVAIDLSLSSLGYAKRKCIEHEMAHIEFAHADIMELGNWDQRFDYIESTGVLHHLEKPIEGWRILTHLLRPKGIMRIALYSKSARQDINTARTLIEAQGFADDPDGIRAFRQYLAEHAQDHPTAAKIMHRPDFYSLSECRDLVFHVQEHCFTLPEIKSALDQLGLQLIGFEASQYATALFKQHHPETKDLTSLTKWHALEQKHPQLFPSMYLFWCQRKD